MQPETAVNLRPAFEALFSATGCKPRCYSSGFTFGAEFLSTNVHIPMGEMILRCAECDVPAPTFGARGLGLVAYWPQISWADWQAATNSRKKP